MSAVGNANARAARTRRVRSSGAWVCEPEAALVPEVEREAGGIDLGLAILSAITTPGTRRSHREIAAYCGCTYGAIWMIEQKALHKLKKRLFMRNDPELRELVAAVVGRAASDSEPRRSHRGELSHRREEASDV